MSLSRTPPNERSASEGKAICKRAIDNRYQPAISLAIGRLQHSSNFDEVRCGLMTESDTLHRLGSSLKLAYFSSLNPKTFGF